MINRIVKMSFAKENEAKFLAIFNANKNSILAFEGCKSVELQKVLNEECSYVTYSNWDTEEHLEIYRNSDFFYSIWKDVKSLFNDDAMAFSTKTEQ